MNTKTKLFFICGILSGPVFVLTFLIEGVFRNAYSQFIHPVSSLSIGEWGWVQQLNFILSGSLIFIFSFGTRDFFQPNTKGSTSGPLLIALTGLGLVGAGIFSTDPIYGYPMDAPLRIAQFTFQGHMHDLCSLFVFVCMPYACFVFRKRFLADRKKSWATYCLVSAFIVIITFILAGVGFKQTPGFVSVGGLLQRISIICGCAWVTVLASYALKKHPVLNNVGKL